MDKPGSQRLHLGDSLNGIVVKSIGGRRFAVKCKGVPDGWTAELHTRKPESIRPGSLGTFWVAKISPLQRSVLLHEGDFGRLPISENMQRRYLAAIRTVLSDSELTGDLLADLRSMVLRIEKKDQADWLTVWRLLEEPPTGDVKLLLAAIEAIRKVRTEAPETLEDKRQELVVRYGDILERVAKRLDR